METSDGGKFGTVGRETVGWKVMVAAAQEPWTSYSVPLDSPSEWTEAWDGIVPGFRKIVFEVEKDASAAAFAIRARGYTAATQQVN